MYGFGILARSDEYLNTFGICEENQDYSFSDKTLSEIKQLDESKPLLLSHDKGSPRIGDLLAIHYVQNKALYYMCRLNATTLAICKRCYPIWKNMPGRKDNSLCNMETMIRQLLPACSLSSLKLTDKQEHKKNKDYINHVIQTPAPRRMGCFTIFSKHPGTAFPGVSEMGMDTNNFKQLITKGLDMEQREKHQKNNPEFNSDDTLCIYDRLLANSTCKKELINILKTEHDFFGVNSNFLEASAESNHVIKKASLINDHITKSTMANSQEKAEEIIPWLKSIHSAVSKNDKDSQNNMYSQAKQPPFQNDMYPMMPPSGFPNNQGFHYQHHPGHMYQTFYPAQPMYEGNNYYNEPYNQRRYFAQPSAYSEGPYSQRPKRYLRYQEEGNPYRGEEDVENFFDTPSAKRHKKMELPTKQDQYKPGNIEAELNEAIVKSVLANAQYRNKVLSMFVNPNTLSDDPNPEKSLLKPKESEESVKSTDNKVNDGKSLVNVYVTSQGASVTNTEEDSKQTLPYDESPVKDDPSTNANAKQTLDASRSEVKRKDNTEKNSTTIKKGRNVREQNKSTLKEIIGEITQ